LYANKDAKRLASKLYRQGKSEFLGEHLSKLAATEAWNGEFHEGTARQHMSESEPDDSDDTVDSEDGEESLLTPEEQRIRLPPLTPLFSPEVEKQQYINPFLSMVHGPTTATRFLGGAVKGKLIRMLRDLKSVYSAPELDRAIQKYLESDDPAYVDVCIKPEKLDSLQVEVRTFIKIQCPSV